MHLGEDKIQVRLNFMRYEGSKAPENVESFAQMRKE